MSIPANVPSARSHAQIPPADEYGGRARIAVWTTFGLLGILLLGYLGVLVFDVSQQSSSWVNDWHIGLEFIASALCIARGLRGGPRRLVALSLGAACLSWTLGDLVLTLESLGGATPSSPSLFDAFYLGFYPLALVAILLFTRGEIIKRSDAPNWLDGVIASLGMAALCAGFAFHGLEKLFEGPSLSAATSLAFPAGDLLLLGIIAGSTVVVTGRSRTMLVLVAIGLAIDSAGDTFSFVGDWSQVGPIVYGISWPAAILVFSISMWLREGGSDRFVLEKISGFVLPAVFACASLVILVGDGWYRFGPIAVGLAALTLVFTGGRLAFRPALYLARERWRSSEERYRLMFEQNPQPMMVYDRRTLEIVAVSDAMVADYGYARAEFDSMTIKDLVPPQDGDSLLAYLADPDGSPDTVAERILGVPGRHRRKDGTIVEIEVTSTNIDLDGRQCRIAHLHDVTERNKAAAEVAVARDQAVEASNMKSAFLANVSHEIRTPMNGVIGMNEMLLDMGLTDKQRDCAEQVARSGQQALAIINDILDLSKIETGHVELDLADFDVHDTIKETCSAAAAHARAKGLQLELQIADGVPVRAHGDGRRIHQVLLNLLANAVKFTAAGEVVVRVSATATPRGSVLTRFEVADSGIGIDPASLARMFEPFTQADVSTTRLYGGTGLGLAIARELVELMGGTIGGQSARGRGSTFWFEVELGAHRMSAAAPAQVSKPEVSSAVTWSGPPLVLVVEDSQINQIVAVRALERCGCRSFVVGDGQEALDALEARRYDAVLMDCQMPKMDGYEATAELRRRERGAPRTPVIAMTAHAMDGDRQRCLDAGMDDYITKPMRHPDLTGVLQRWIPERLVTIGEAELAPDRLDSVG